MCGRCTRRNSRQGVGKLSLVCVTVSQHPLLGLSPFRPRVRFRGQLFPVLRVCDHQSAVPQAYAGITFRRHAEVKSGVVKPPGLGGRAPRLPWDGSPAAGGGACFPRHAGRGGASAAFLRFSSLRCGQDPVVLICLCRCRSSGAHLGPSGGQTPCLCRHILSRTPTEPG